MYARWTASAKVPTCSSSIPTSVSTVPECPAEAIVAEEDVPGDQENFIAINAEKAPNWPAITRSKSPLEDADDWNGTPNKLQYLEG